MVKKRKRITFNLSLCLCAFILVITSASWGLTFKDLKGHWGEKFVERLVNEGAITGYDTDGDGKGDEFRPNSNITRAEIIIVLTKALRIHTLVPKDKVSPYQDLKDTHWASKYAWVAKQKGIIPNEMIVDNNFNPSQQATRAEIAAIIILSMGKSQEAKVILNDPSQLKTFLNFKDVNSNFWAAGYIAQAVKDQIVKGYPDMTFKPKASVTRAEAAAMIIRMLEKISPYRLTELGKEEVLPEGAYSGLILDCRGMNIKSSQSPKIYDELGEEIYGTVKVYTEYVESFGVMGYYYSIESAKERVGQNPLIIKPINLQGRGGVLTDPVISQEDAKIIKDAVKIYDFLSKFYVAVVMDEN